MYTFGGMSYEASIEIENSLVTEQWKNLACNAEIKFVPEYEKIYWKIMAAIFAYMDRDMAELHSMGLQSQTPSIRDNENDQYCI